MRRPSFCDTRSTSLRTSSSPPESCRAARPTPVGARYSPNASRSAAPHSPVVTPAFAAAIEGGITLRPSFAAARNSFSAAATALASRAARQAFSRSICSASTSCGTVRIEPSPVDSGDASVSMNLLTPTTICSPRSIDSSRAVLLSTSFDFM